MVCNTGNIVFATFTPTFTPLTIDRSGLTLINKVDSATVSDWNKCSINAQTAADPVDCFKLLHRDCGLLSTSVRHYYLFSCMAQVESHTSRFGSRSSPVHNW